MGSLIAYAIGQRVEIKQDTTLIIEGLLHNIYHAFDFHNESIVYDTLERSVSGDLLTEIYLETQRGLQLENQGGARVKVRSVQLTDIVVSSLDNGGSGFLAEVTWQVIGDVGHWGHVHQRTNQYQAQLQIQPVERQWKLTGLEVLFEERL